MRSRVRFKLKELPKQTHLLIIASIWNGMGAGKAFSYENTAKLNTKAHFQIGRSAVPLPPCAVHTGITCILHTFTTYNIVYYNTTQYNTRQDNPTQPNNTICIQHNTIRYNTANRTWSRVSHVFSHHHLWPGQRHVQRAHIKNTP